jgi:HEAT repeat protein
MIQRTFAIVAIAIVVVASPAAAQDASPGAIARAEATAFAEGWTALARGDVATASSVATQVLRDYPRNPSSVALAVEVAVAAQGWRGGLDAYEQWIAGRPVEHFYTLRRVARAVLYDALASSRNIRLRLEVADALALDADPDLSAWLAMLAAPTPGGQQDSRTLAAAGNPEAVAALAASLAQDPRPVDSIAALGRSRNPVALTPLVQMLESPRIEVRAAAATALGDLGVPGATTQLRRLLDDQHLLPRMAAVGALLKLGDPAGMTQAYEWFRSDVGDVKLKAAEYTASQADTTWQTHVRQLLQDPDPMVRIGAARLIGKHDPGAAMWALQSLANDENLAIREEAQRVLPEAIGGDFAELRRYLRAADADTRIRAALRIVELTR